MRYRRLVVVAMVAVAVGGATPAEAPVADAISVVAFTPASGVIRGWDGSIDLDAWLAIPGNYVETTFAYTLETEPLSQVVSRFVGLPATVIGGWTLITPGSGLVTYRQSLDCTGGGVTSIDVSEHRFSLGAMTLPDGSSIGSLVRHSRPVDYRFVCGAPALPDLTVMIVAPAFAREGADLADTIEVEVANRGGAPAPGTVGTLDPSSGYLIDVVLSTDFVVPEGFAIPSPTFVEDGLLLGGRFSNTEDLPPLGVRRYTDSTNQLPTGTPPADYRLCARVDPGNRVVERDEGNNVGCETIRILPDRILIDFERESREDTIHVHRADATDLYADLGVRFPSGPIIVSNSALASGFQLLFAGSLTGRPERSCTTLAAGSRVSRLTIELAEVLEARQVRFEARNLGLISIPVGVTAIATSSLAGAPTEVDRVELVSRSSPGALRPVEIITLAAADSEPAITSVSIEYGTCPPHVAIDNLEVWLGGS